jgi:hypothetical protein
MSLSEEAAKEIRDLASSAAFKRDMTIVAESRRKFFIKDGKVDGLVRSLLCRHCEERSDAAISFFQAVTNCEIASLCSQRRLKGLFTNTSRLMWMHMWSLFVPLMNSSTMNQRSSCP